MLKGYLEIHDWLYNIIQFLNGVSKDQTPFACGEKDIALINRSFLMAVRISSHAEWQLSSIK